MAPLPPDSSPPVGPRSRDPLIRAIADRRAARTGEVDDVGLTPALSVSTVRRCVHLIADSIAGADVGEWHGDDRLQPSRIVRRPAARMTRYEWLWRVASTLALWDSCVLWHRGGVDSEGVPGSLLPLTPDQVSPEGGWDGIAPYAEPAAFLIGGERVSADAVTIIRRAPVAGVDPMVAGFLHAARELLSASTALDRYGSTFWRAGAAPIVQITTDQELSIPQAEEISDRWVERRALGPEHPAVFGKGAKASPFGADLSSETAATAGDRLIAGIARWFGLPAHLVYGPSLGASLTYSTAETEGLDVIRWCLNGYAGPIEAVWSDLLPGDHLTGRRVRIDLGYLSRADQESRIRAESQAIGSGIYTVEEARTMEGLPPPEPADEPAPEPPAEPPAEPAPTDLPAPEGEPTELPEPEQPSTLVPGR